MKCVNAGWIIWMMQLNMQVFVAAFPAIEKTLKIRKHQTVTSEIVHPRLKIDGNKILVTLKISGKPFYLQLIQDDEVFKGNITIFNQEMNDLPDNEENCHHYKGSVHSHQGGQAALLICHMNKSMSGVILTTDGEAFILLPADQFALRKKRAVSPSSDDVTPHVIERPSEQYFCGLGVDDRIATKENLASISSRQRRSDSGGQKIIEIAVYIDYSLYKKFMGTASVTDSSSLSKLRDSVLAIVNQVQLIYNYKSLRTKFKLVVVKLEVLSENKESPDPAEGDIDQYLDNFCYWQSLKNPAVSSKDHWDHALMLTGLDLHKVLGDDQRNEKVLGLAWVNGMCRPQHSCTLNEGSSFEAAFVIAHEMGHSLGMLHDGRGNDCDPNAFLMSEKTGPGKITWSSCSNTYLNKFFQKGFGSCLEDDNTPSSSVMNHEGDDRLPGERFPLAEQCKLSLGENFKPHVVPKAPFNDVCRELWCVSGLWASVAHPALEGSDCGVGKQCLQGICTKTRENGNNNNKSPSSATGLVSDMKEAVSDFLDRLKSAFKLLTA